MLLPIPVPLLQRLTFGRRPKSKQKVWPLASGPTSSGSLAPSLFQGPAAKGHPWPIAALAASMPLNPLHNDSTRPPDGASGVACEIAATERSHAPRGNAFGDAPRQAFGRWQISVAALYLVVIDAERLGLRYHAERGNDQRSPSIAAKPHCLGSAFFFLFFLRGQLRRLGLPNPVRRPSGGAVERGVWHGCQTRNDGPGMATVTTLGTVPERGELSVAKPGCRARFLFGYFLFRASKEKVTRRKGENGGRGRRRK